MDYQKDALVILAKYPRVGNTKTRLAPQLGEIMASRISEFFLVDLLRRFVVVKSLRIVIAGSSIDEAGEFNSLLEKYSLLKESIEVFLPKTTSMARDAAASYEYVSQNSRKVILIAGDIPYFSIKMLRRLFRSLNEHDIVFHPNVDGTVCPFGMKNPAQFFSGFSSPLLSQWLFRIRSLKFSYECLDPIFDIDRFEDLTTFYYWQLFLEGANQLESHCLETMTFLKSFFGR